MRSIRRNLLAALMTTMLVALVLASVATYRAAVQQANSLLDYQLRQFALGLRDRSLSAADPAAVQGDVGDLDYSIQVWNENGVVLYFSYPAHVFPNAAQIGYSTVQTPDGPWRVYAARGRSSVIQVAQPMSRRDALAGHAAWLSLRPLLLLFPVMGLVIWVVVGRGLAPVAKLARAISMRTPAAMEPVSERIPAELQPLVRALNDLLARLNSALRSQRQFVADAAHELRTPLAALQLQAQLVERATDADDRTSAIAELKAGLQRATHLVQQLLSLAREEPGAAQQAPADVHLRSVLEAVVTEHQTIAIRRGVSLSLAAGQGDPYLRADKASVRTLLSNVVDNAVRYTPAGGRVSVSLEPSPRDSVVVTVDDTGPGIPIEDRARVFDRFYRREGLEEPGTGLGLAIVRTIADRYGLNIELETAEGGGLSARVEFPKEVLVRVTDPLGS